MNRLALLLALAMLFGCTREWRTSEPVQPLTYAAPSYRTVSSVGRLSRLAVMPAMLNIDADAEQRAMPEWNAQRQRLAQELQASVSAYLVNQKGYETLNVDMPLPSIDTAAIRTTGQQLNVDGIVLVERWIVQPWSTAKGILNVFTLNIPLFRALSAVNLRISIHETLSGRLVWQSESKGEESDLNTKVDLPRVLGDLENAVPAQLRR
jgi:Tfp pilus assembly protein PilN